MSCCAPELVGDSECSFCRRPNTGHSGLLQGCAQQPSCLALDSGQRHISGLLQLLTQLVHTQQLTLLQLRLKLQRASWLAVKLSQRDGHRLHVLREEVRDKVDAGQIRSSLQWQA